MIALFIHTRAWEREQQAKELEMQALSLERHAILAGSEADKAHAFVEGLREQARKLRLPEILANEKPKSVRDAAYDHDFKAFLQPYKYRRGGGMVEEA